MRKLGIDKFIQLGLILPLFVTFTTACGSSKALTWNDLKSAGESHKSHPSFHSLQKGNKKNKNPGYIKNFRLALMHQDRREFKSAILWYANSYLESYKRKSRNFYPAAVYAFITKFSNKFKNKSPIANFVLYKMAQCYHNLYENKYALKFIDLVSTTNPILQNDLKFLKGKIYSKLNTIKSVKILESLIAKVKNPIYSLKLAGMYHKKKKLKQALTYYLKAISKYQNSWTMSLASKEIDNLLQEDSTLKKSLTQIDKIRMFEAYRIRKLLPKAVQWFNSVGKLENSNRFEYYLFSGRLYVTTRKFPQILKLKNKITQLSQNQQELIYFKLGNSIMHHYRYSTIARFIPIKFNSYRVMKIRLQALARIRFHSRKEEAKFVLENFDKNSHIAERVYFHTCFPHITTKNFLQASSCLEELSQLTQNTRVGGRARFFLGQISQSQNKKVLAAKYYRQVYLNSPSHYFAFKALKLAYNLQPGNATSLPNDNINAIRSWISQNYGNDKLMKQFFNKKKNDNNYAVDLYWQDWEKKLKQIETSLSQEEMHGALFLMLGYKKTAKKYFHQANDDFKKLLVYQKIGIQIMNTHLKYYYLKHYLKRTKKETDIFTASNLGLKTLFPLPYLKFVQKQAKRFNIEPSRIYALMKQESEFRANVGSPAGAQGLMQVMPATAKDLNRREKIKKLNLRNPYHSIKLGTRFYRDMSKMFKGHFEKVATAYNAGPGRLLEWQKRYKGFDGALFWEKIPFEETYLYIQRTRRFYDRYKELIKYL